MIGGPITQESLGKDVPVCSSESETGCIIAWNARGPRYVGGKLEFATSENPDAIDKMTGRICVNPLTWASDQAYAPESMHKGALFLDAENPEILPEFADSKCDNGTLVITHIGQPPRDFKSKLLDWLTGPENYHAFEYQLFYMNIRENAVKRVNAFLNGKKDGKTLSVSPD